MDKRKLIGVVIVVCASLALLLVVLSVDNSDDQPVNIGSTESQQLIDQGYSDEYASIFDIPDCSESSLSALTTYAEDEAQGSEDRAYAYDRLRSCSIEENNDEQSLEYAELAKGFYEQAGDIGSAQKMERSIENITESLNFIEGQVIEDDGVL